MMLVDLSGPLLRSARDYRRYRASAALSDRIMRRIAAIRHLWWSMLTSSDIHPCSTIGRNVRMPHPNGIVIHEDAIIGDDCMIMQQVTIGQLASAGAPVIGSAVYVGAGAKILGPIRVGNQARIGANAVVLQDVPDGYTAVGTPARLIPR